MNLDEGGGKAKHRWNHGPKPYSRPGERNPSLREKLNSVANFLMPSWMPVLLGWPDSTSSNNEGRQLEDDEEEEVNVTESSTAPSIEDRPPTIGISPVPLLKSPDLASSSRILKPQLIGFEPTKAAIAENGSEYSAHSLSTSGCSSMRDNQPDARSSGEEFSNADGRNRRKGIPTARAPLRSSFIKAAAQKRTRDMSESIGEQDSDMSNSRLSHSALWSDDSMTQVRHSRPQPTSRGNKPAFNVSGFGSPTWKDRSLLNNSIHNSPFYSGATTFMGASAYRHVTQKDPYVGTPSKRQRVQPRPVPANHRTAGMSTTAKKILDVLEKMSTPLADAKRIPMSQHYLDATLSFRRVPLKRDYSMRNLPRESPEKSMGGPPRKRLMMPGSTSIARNMHPLNSRSISQNASTPAVGTNRSTAPPHVYVPAASQGVLTGHSPGKMKSVKKSTVHYSAKSQGDELLPPLSLPSVVLPITSLPVIELPSCKPARKDVLATPSLFTFSSPIHQSTPELAIPKSSTDKIADFTFSSPLPASDTTKTKVEARPPLAKATTSSTQLQNFSFLPPKATTSTTLKLKTKSESSTPAAGLTPSSELKSGSVLDVLLGKPKSTKSKETSEATVTKEVGFGDKFKPPAGNWECPCCMLSNTSTVTACPACTTKKPGTKELPSAPAPQATQTSSGFGDKFKPAAGTWECDACMLRNSSKDTKCIACETIRAGVIPSAPSTVGTVTPSGFKLSAFSTSSSDSAPAFKFGFSKAPSTSAPTATSSSAVGFAFGNSTASASASSSCATGFVFGAKASSDTAKPLSGGFVFGSTPTVSASESTPAAFGALSESSEKSVGKGSAVDKPSSGSGFTFGVLATSSTALTAPSVVTEVKACGSTVTPQISKGTDTAAPFSSFSFAAPSTKSEGSAVLAVPTTTEATAKPSTNFFFKPPDGSQKPKPQSSDETAKQATATSGSGGGFTFSLPHDTATSSTKRERDTDEPSSKQPKSNLPSFNSFGSSTSISTSAVSFTFGVGSSTGTTKTSSQPLPITGTPGSLFNTGPATMSSATVLTPALTTALISSKPSTSMASPEASKPSADVSQFGSPSSTVMRTVSIPMFGTASLSTSMPSMVGSATTMTTSVFGSIPSSSTFMAQPTTSLPVFATASSGPIATTVPSQSSLPPFSSLPSSAGSVPTASVTSGVSAPLIFGSVTSVSNAATTTTTAAVSSSQAFTFSSGVGSFSGFGTSSATTPAMNFGVPSATTVAPFQSSSVFGSAPQSQFTSPTTTTAMPFSTVTTTVPSGTFSFGASSATPFSASAPAFGVPSATTAPAAAGFGNPTPAPLFGSPTPSGGFGGFGTPAANSSSIFGGSAPGPTGGFNFNSGSSMPFGSGMQQAANNEVFTFSANQPSAPRQPEPTQSPFGQQPASNPAAGSPLVSFSATPQLNFGSGASSGSNIFQFSAAAPPGSNPFEPRSSSTGTRPIRRAVRRRKP